MYILINNQIFTYGPYLICKYTQTCTCRKSTHTTLFFSFGTALSLFWCARIQGHVQFIQYRRLPYASMYVLVCAFKIFSETIEPTEAKFHDENLFKGFRSFVVLHLNIVNLWGGAFCGAFTTNVAPQCRAFSRALEIEKLKAPLFRGPERAGDTNDWCIIKDALFQTYVNMKATRRTREPRENVSKLIRRI